MSSALGTPATPSAGTASSRAARSPTLCFLASRSAIRHPSRRTSLPAVYAPDRLWQNVQKDLPLTRQVFLLDWDRLETYFPRYPRYRKVTICPLVQVSFGLKVVLLVPVVMPCSAAQATALA